jgi:hypothetical protein
MPSQKLSVAVPAGVLTQIRKRARQAKHSVEAEVVHLLAEAVAGANGAVREKSPAGKKKKPIEIDDADKLPPDIEAAIAEVERLGDDDLNEALTPILTKKQAKRLADLNFKAQDTGLTAAEKIEQDELLHVAEKSMIVRAAVLAELRKRGVDVSRFVTP